MVSGPIHPTHKRIPSYSETALTINKKSREQFRLSSYKLLIDMSIAQSAKTVDALMKLELPSGVEVEIKV